MGDKIFWHQDGLVHMDKVLSPSHNNTLFRTEIGPRLVHRRQIFKVIRKKKKRELRVVVETQWGCDGLNKCLHFSEDSAINFMQTERPGVQYKIVRFREVL